MTGAQFEISIDGVPRTYRDQKDLALLAAQILKSRNPNSVVKAERLEDRGGDRQSHSRRRNGNGMALTMRPTGQVVAADHARHKTKKAP